MSPTYVRPAPPLDAYIEAISFHDAPMPCRRSHLLPSASANLEINFGGSFRLYAPAQTEPFAVCTESWWAGTRSAHHRIDWPSDIRLLLVDFKPGGAYPFLRFPLSDLAHQIVDAATIWGSFANELRERLHAAPSLETRIALVEQLLLQRLREQPHGLAAVQYADAAIARRHGALSIRALSEHMGISQKQLIVRCKQLIGVTPKELARLYRFHHAVRSLDPARDADWATLAQDAGYYDQAHMVNDFSQCVGYSPTRYLRMRRHFGDALNPNVTGLLHLADG